MKGAWRKVYVSILDSEWLAQDLELRAFAIELLLLADQRGFIRMDYGAIAQRVRRDVTTIVAMMNTLTQGQAASKSQGFGGAFLTMISVGYWKIINFTKYQNTATDDARKLKKAENLRKWRARKREEKKRNQVKSNEVKVKSLLKPEVKSALPSKSETALKPGETAVKPDEVKVKSPIEKENEKENVCTYYTPKLDFSKPLELSAWLEQLQNDPAYSEIDLEYELELYRRWAREKEKKPTRSLFVRWWLKKRVEDEIDEDEADEISREEPEPDWGQWTDERRAACLTLYPEARLPDRFDLLPSDIINEIRALIAKNKR
jgi:hypothetical protein